MNRSEILRAHYLGLLKKAAAWSGLVALVAAIALPAPASAAQLTSRSTTLGTSQVTVATTYDFTFNPGSSTTVEAIKIQLCTSPLANVSCTEPAGASLDDSSAALVTSAPTSATFQSGWAEGTGGLVSSDHTFYLVNATGSALNSATSYTIRLQNVENPTAAATFYTRITTYDNDDATGERDYGAMAVSTAERVTASANVQEQLSFCVYISSCGSGAPYTVNVGTGTDNVLSTTQTTGGISKMSASTNAQAGYAITYITTSSGGVGGTQCARGFSSTLDCIAAAGSTSSPEPADGTAIFGINLAANTTINAGGALGTAPSGGSGVAIGEYDDANEITFEETNTPKTVANSAGGPSVNTEFTVSYVAQAGNTTKAGAYSAIFTWIATGTF
jgi:hypothetical protein